MAKITVTRAFASRVELDDFVRTRFGIDAAANLEHTIELSKDEMATLALSEDTTVYGVRVVAEAEEVVPPKK